MPVHKIILLPVLSIGLLVAAREAKAGIVDLGVISQSVQINGTITGLPGFGFDTYTFDDLLFVGPYLNMLIGGQTVSTILSQDLGAQNIGTLGFNFPDLGESGTMGANASTVDQYGKLLQSATPSCT